MDNSIDNKEPVIEYYVLFHNHTAGLKLYECLKTLKVKATIVPTPRRASVCCGISLLIPKEAVETVKNLSSEENIDIMDIVALPRTTNAFRDKFC